MKYKLLALDLDGTALGSDPDRFAAGVPEALDRAAAEGCQVVIATGRPMKNLPADLREERPAWLRYVVLCDGAEVWDLKTDSCLRRRSIGPQALDSAERLGREYGIPLEYVDTTGRYHICARDWDALMQLPVTPFHRRVLRQRAAAFDGPASRLAEREILKINILFVPAAQWEPVRAGLAAAGMKSVESAPGMLEVTAPEAGKLEAVEFLCKRLCLSMDQVMALGDSGNDAALLAGAGWGVAMENAPEWVKSTGKAVTGKNTDGGAAAAIYRYLLEQDVPVR